MDKKGYKGKQGHGGNAIMNATKRVKDLHNMRELGEKEIADEEGLADMIGKEFKGDSIKSTQLRKFFSEVKDIERKLNEGDWDAVKGDFYLLRPKLAYANARKLIPNDFFKLLSECMKKIDTNGSDNKQKIKNYGQFVIFLEAIVAYHRYYNPKSR